MKEQLSCREKVIDAKLVVARMNFHLLTRVDYEVGISTTGTTHKH